MRKRIVAGVMAGLVGIAATPVWACWAAVPLEKLLRDNPVVVAGKITRIDVAPAPEDGKRQRAYDTGYIRVSKVLKNALKKTEIKVGDELPLSMPSVNRGIMVSTDIRYPKGKEGIWILELKDGKYWATYPGDFQSKDKESTITSLLKKPAE